MGTDTDSEKPNSEQPEKRLTDDVDLEEDNNASSDTTVLPGVRTFGNRQTARSKTPDPEEVLRASLIASREQMEAIEQLATSRTRASLSARRRVSSLVPDEKKEEIVEAVKKVVEEDDFGYMPHGASEQF
mmetsp:Transcript_35794/g.43215  ORF Transcript_35794/g.43215 Transcript_35794/m.43215 type:complete len:130 (-) Transcript_35794:170-559(-)|eukprot:CAMPEP_0197847226 /NCGR_PEP_ID=MMETSP1438-20131217/5594_1 /TAXON_ID=1461541 /ORGANISM="Pterosperma sp., Strain CCMP1384" /LENGTH=129 /DNA_ID=CAMNT_0043459089 /DNA_START=203 /DNA_END=592 /DNA_ORIENTATION=-